MAEKKSKKFKLPTVADLIEAGVRLGHKKSKWNPQMASFIAKQRSGIHVIDVEKTIEGLKKVLEFIAQSLEEKREILFVCSKSPINLIVKQFAQDLEMPYASGRWLGGSLTNWKVLSKRIQQYNDYLEQKKSGEIEKYTKKERTMMEKEMTRLGQKLDGLKNMQKMPAALFVIGLKESKVAIKEAVVKKIPVIAVCDTDAEIKEIDYPIAGSDDSLNSVKKILEVIKQAF